MFQQIVGRQMYTSPAATGREEEEKKMQALILALTLLAAAWSAVGGAPAAAPGDPMKTNDGGNPLPPRK